ncbi:DEAD/DEAH box helicase [Rhizobium lentis]|uniref:DEAD/DEAH box helicase family protein n=1 Tax=Rhizobium lentis TaxID=1138194 RepID=A0A9Q3ME48_9HYPH|nr:DEAD/DEAH box helicase family protein [Rhizobium lentis]MBX5024476.1 DEAD/DEAH box helicase family protein [Rhizobium lentis]MBX5049170.1 DEAD/DEAH box helicase family protein [Rhizobium lentis]MBX5060852.1 DEAD/DEAH box helicase family protein [Rhizobium lentis]
MSINLLPFQTRASDQITARYLELAADRRRPMEHQEWFIPFYQALSSVTGSGKTAILADTLSQLRSVLHSEPIVLWISKNKAVVDQAFANFETGGKYAHLIEQFTTTYLGAAKISEIIDDTQAVVMFATVGSFNRNKDSKETLRVHQKGQDENGETTWKLLADRKAPGSSRRRPLIVVYDEAHNLSDQQTDLLFELEPDIILAASATMRTPGKLGHVIDRLRHAGWSDKPIADEPGHTTKCLVTAVQTREPVREGLIKKQIILGGYATEMETTINDMIVEFNRTSQIATDLNVGFLPKAIYVCKTNVSQEDGVTDNPSSPFLERRAPPILIWRHLTEQLGISAGEIAVYGDLKVEHKISPLPADFKLFSGGEDDFAAFSAGNYRHIIFNQALQEGWDDPACAFAYVDKSMASPTQVEQIIGRVLRQPGAKHYSDPGLNTANFYIRTSGRQEFQKILDVVRRKISGETPEVQIDGFSNARDRARAQLRPKKHATVPEIHIDADAAVIPLVNAISTMHDYRSDKVNVLGPGELTRAVQQIGEKTGAAVETIQKEHSNRIVARWLIRRHMQSRYPEAVKTVDWADPKFDVLVEVTSAAAGALRAEAERLVDVYLSEAELAFEDSNLYTVPMIFARSENLEAFENAIHEGYSDLNPGEIEIARAIDKTGLLWARNPVNGGYSIPLLEKGDSRRFFPDFLVWKKDVIVAIDPKGKHLLATEAGKKLLAIRDEKGKQRVLVRFVTAGKWSHETMKQISQEGYSVWRLNTSSQMRCTHHTFVESAISKCLD